MIRPVGIVTLIWLAASFGSAAGQTKSRARDLGVPFDGTPGPLNAITDVPGVEVGQVTLVSGRGPLVVGKGPVRTGVTAILPRGKTSGDPVMAGWFTLNGNGEMTGTTWIEESGFLGGPVMITNTHSVGIVHDAVIEWLVRRRFDFDWSLPVVAETWDGSLNDINGFHVTKQHAFATLDSARGGPVAEGNVGGGTGMVCHQFKGGIGTASRRFTMGDKTYAVGVLVQCNYGLRRLLRVAGVPVGAEISDHLPCYDTSGPLPSEERAPSGEMGGLGGNSSGDIFVAFSTANLNAAASRGLQSVPTGTSSSIRCRDRCGARRWVIPSRSSSPMDGATTCSPIGLRTAAGSSSPAGRGTRLSCSSSTSRAGRLRRSPRTAP